MSYQEGREQGLTDHAYKTLFCQRCKSNRILKMVFEFRPIDGFLCFDFSCKGINYTEKNIIKNPLYICLDCGQTQGKWPVLDPIMEKGMEK